MDRRNDLRSKIGRGEGATFPGVKLHRRKANAIELNIRRDPTIYDGQFSNNGWLQELPKPMTKLTWDNAVAHRPQDGASGCRSRPERHGRARAERQERLPARSGFRPGIPTIPSPSFSATAAAAPAASAPRGALTPTALRTSAAPWVATGLQIRKTGDSYELASTQGYQSMDTPNGAHRPLVRETTLEEYRKDPDFAKEEGEEPAAGPDALQALSLRRRSLCLGHGHRSELLRGLQQLHHGLPVGEQHRRGRQGADRASAATCTGFASTPTTRATATIPRHSSSRVPCMQCENAPCEVVCPVGATNHSQRRPERHGLQPLRGHALLLEQLSLQSAPLQLPALPGLGDAAIQDDAQSRRHRAQPRRDGKVHATACSASASTASMPKRASVREGKEIKINDGELQTACQQSCPAGAIVFGNINDPNSRVSKVEGAVAQLQPAGRIEHAPAHHVSGGSAQSESGAEG